MNRAYSTFEIKSFDEEKRIVIGIASTPEPDRGGDRMSSTGAKFSLPMAFRFKHVTDVGEVFAADVTPAGIVIKARVLDVPEPGRLKDEVDYAWHSIKHGLAKGLSIGWNPRKAKPNKFGGLDVEEWDWHETSAVPIPMNAQATITQIKSIDADFLAASGVGQAAVARPSAGGTARVVRTSANAGAKSMKTLAERKQAFVAEKAAKVAKLNTLVGDDDGTTLSAEAQTEFDTLTEEIKSIDGHLARLETLEQVNKDNATPAAGDTPAAAAAARGGQSVITVKSNLPPGTGFTRYAMALAASRGSRMEAYQFAKRWEKTTPEVAMILKAAVDAGTTTDSAWAAPLVVYQNLASEFIELLRPATIIGRINGFRRVPFNVSMPRQTSGSTVGWVGQGKPKPVGELAFDQVSLGMAKAAGIIVIAEELARSSNPSAEAVVSQDLRDAITKFLDTQFIDPAVAAVSNVSPAAVTNGASVIDSTGTNAAALRADFASALAVWTAAGLSIAGGVVVMTESQAISLSMIVNAFGQAEFPGITATGGTLFGLPVVTSENIPAEGSSPAGQRIVLLKPGEILMADDGGITIDVSREASVQMNTVPDDPASASTVLTSLWQNNLVGIRAERFINWLKRRSAAAVVIEGAVYTG